MAGVDHLYEFSSWLVGRIGVSMGASLFVNAIPDETTGPAVFLLEERGPAPLVLQSTSYIRRPRFRLDIRSTGPGPDQSDYPDITNARNLAQTAYQACLDIAGEQLLPSTDSTSPGNWLFAIPDTEPYLLGRDDHNRVVFSFGVQCERQSSPAAF